jgi:hypothetical protein
MGEPLLTQRQNETVVIVGVLADEIDATGCEGDPPQSSAEPLENHLLRSGYCQVIQLKKYATPFVRANH